MSKKQKKTLDELLEEALVSEGERPYEIPENWVWMEIKHILKPMLNTSPSKLNIENFHYVDVESIDNKKQELRAYKELSTIEAPSRAQRKVSKNDVLISLVRPYLKNIAKIGFQDEKLIASTAFYVCSVKESIDANYLYYYLMSPYATEYLIKHTKGDNSPSVRSGDFELLPIPISTIKEQKRIADKIEMLFSKVEEANHLIEEARETFELRRAGILEAALKGKLTTSFRENEIVEDAHVLYEKLKSEATFKAKVNSEILETDIRYSVPSSWKWVKIGDVLKITSGGTPKKAFKEYYVDGEVPWIKTGEIKWNRISEAEEYITQLGVEKSSAKWLPKNSVLVAMYGQGLTRGRAAILDIEATCNQAVCALLPSPYILPEYLYYYFMEGYNRFRSIAKGGNQENLSATVISEFLLPLPPLEEQLKIVELLDGFFTKELEVKELLNINVDEMKSAILSKAFKGELGTNDLTDEPAIELLKSIIQEKP